MSWIAVFIGGGLGSLARYGLGMWIGNPSTSSFPWSTLAANTISSLIIGMLMGAALAGKDSADSLWKSLLAVGFCGGFSTFSAFSMETIELAQNGQSLLALLNGLSNLFCSILATLAGVLIARSF